MKSVWIGAMATALVAKVAAWTVPTLPRGVIGKKHLTAARSVHSARTLLKLMDDDYLDDDYLDDDYLDDNYQDDEYGESFSDFMENEMSDYDSSSVVDNDPPSVQQVRATVAGVSVERDTGFWVILQLSNDLGYWPLPVTRDPMDRHAATSGQALTIVQLLSQVDMAGVILPPHILAQLVLVSLEEASEHDDGDDGHNNYQLESWQTDLVNNVQEQNQRLHHSFSSYKPDKTEKLSDFSYTEASLWIRSRIKLPLCTLDQVHLDLSKSSESSSWTTNLQVAIRNATSTSPSCWTLADLQESTVAHVLHQDYCGPQVSKNFLALALAFRYRAPLVLTVPSASSSTVPRFYKTLDDLQQAFPLFTTVSNLQRSSQRVVHNIEKSYQIHQLQAALKVARTKQDYGAMAKIQQKIDEWDAESLKELPVQAESDMDSMQ